MTKHTNSRSQASSDAEWNCSQEFRDYNSLAEIDEQTFKSTTRKCSACHQKKPTIRVRLYFIPEYSPRICFSCLYQKSNGCTPCQIRLLDAFWTVLSTPTFCDRLIYAKTKLRYIEKP